jgi:hypothetical protein
MFKFVTEAKNIILMPFTVRPDSAMPSIRLFVRTAFGPAVPYRLAYKMA